jgi:dipeptidyl aminopeptidase/acylaminoacyl peptidase
MREIDRPEIEKLLVASAEPKDLEDWSRDGRFILYRVQNAKGSRDLWAVAITGDAKPLPLATTSFEEQGGRFSPDGRWIAYSSNETGQGEIYVQPFPGPGGKVQIATGVESLLQGIQWRRDGHELFFVGIGNRVMAVPITLSGSTVKAGAPVALFTAPAGGFFVSADGQRFLVSTITAEPAPITVLLNWTGLRK